MTFEEFKSEALAVDFFYEYIEDYTQLKIAEEKFHQVKKIAETKPQFQSFFDKINPLLLTNTN